MGWTSSGARPGIVALAAPWIRPSPTAAMAATEPAMTAEKAAMTTVRRTAPARVGRNTRRSSYPDPAAAMRQERGQGVTPAAGGLGHRWERRPPWRAGLRGAPVGGGYAKVSTRV